MPDWNPELYLQFQRQRTQPAIDLANRARACSPKTIADLGCGPGNSTAVLYSLFPDSEIIGLDNSQSMVEKARSLHPELSFRQEDAGSLSGQYDLLFSNACLQWVPGHKTLLPHLMDRLNPGGMLAVQVPRNGEEPLMRAITRLGEDPKWHFQKKELEPNMVLNPEDYYRILSSCAGEFQIWETVYYHMMPSHQALLDWVRSTRLRPYLNALSPEEGRAFEQELLEQAKALYPFTENGEILFRFRRLFFTAIRTC